MTEISESMDNGEVEIKSDRSFGFVNKHGDFKCNKCGEYTNEYYIIVPNMTCWNCDTQLLGSHIDTIKDLQTMIAKMR